MGNLSKYRQALIKVSVNESIYGSKEIYKSLDEAVKKAEKYDDLMNNQTEWYIVGMKESLKRVEELEQEIQKLKENIEDGR